MDKLNISLQNGQKELVLRTGQAEEIEQPEALVRAGKIESVSRYIAKREEIIDKNNTHIVVDRRAGTISLYENERSQRGVTIIGSIIPNPDLLNFSINSDRVFNLKELATLIRKSKIFFKDRDNSELLKQLNNFTFNRKVEGKIQDDRRGNIDRGFKSELTQSVQMHICLDMPIYEGFDNVLFNAEIFVDVNDGGAKFWFESDDLIILKKDLMDKKIDKELAEVEGFLILEQQ